MDHTTIMSTQQSQAIKPFLVVGIVGVLLWFFPAGMKQRLGLPLPASIELLITELATALIISAVVGGVLEWRFRHRVVKDVVGEALGYLLPEPIRSEMIWIYGLNVVRTNYTHSFRVEHVDCETVRLTERLHYDIENRSSESKSVELVRNVDETHYATEKSQIIGAGYTRGSEREEFRGTKLTARIRDDGWAITFSDKIELRPQEKVSVWFDTSQIRRFSDRETVVLLHAVERPQIEISVPLDMEYDIGVQHRERLTRISPNAYRLEGSLLPYQGISLRWWLKAK
jgi:hypothetical protein